MAQSACMFTFDDSPLFAGFAQGTTWNGFDNVSVTVETARAIDAWLADQGGVGHGDDDLIEKIPAGADGLISLAGGYATQIVTPIILEVELMDEADPALREAARTHGALPVRKYWSPREAIPGDGELCLFALADLDRARDFLTDVFGPSEAGATWRVVPVVAGVLYAHRWE